MIVKLIDLNKKYKDVLAVNNVNIEVAKGDRIGLLGPNGAGKTTTIKMLCGVEKPDSGCIELFNKKFTGVEKEIKRKIGIVPQDLAIYETLTARENLNYFGSLYGLSKDELKKNVDEVLKMIGLMDADKKLAKNFSGGMKRRLNIGCAIVHKPELLIMDEPTVGIDPQSRNHILDFSFEYAKTGATIIYTSHYMEEVEKLCNKVFIMDLGKVISCGNIEKVIEQANIDEKIFLKLDKYDDKLIYNLEKIQGVSSCSVLNDQIVLNVQKENRVITSILTLVAPYGIVNFNSEKATLEDVFLSLTGKKLRDEGENGK